MCTTGSLPGTSEGVVGSLPPRAPPGGPLPPLAGLRPLTALPAALSKPWPTMSVPVQPRSFTSRGQGPCHLVGTRLSALRVEKCRGSCRQAVGWGHCPWKPVTSLSPLMATKTRQAALECGPAPHAAATQTCLLSSFHHGLRHTARLSPAARSRTGRKQLPLRQAPSLSRRVPSYISSGSLPVMPPERDVQIVQGVPGRVEASLPGHLRWPEYCFISAC